MHVLYGVPMCRPQQNTRNEVGRCGGSGMTARTVLSPRDIRTERFNPFQPRHLFAQSDTRFLSELCNISAGNSPHPRRFLCCAAAALVDGDWLATADLQIAFANLF